jgi:mercuric ion transport protein
MTDRTILRTGVIGSIVAAICCFTPVLVILLGAVGLSAWLGWLDYLLFPALALFLGITAYGLWRRQQTAASCTPSAPPKDND